jgi:hypothetical protein
MLDDLPARAARDSDYVEFLAAGTPGVGAYHCSECGYGITLRAPLPVCPMCSGENWERAAWSPLARARSSNREVQTPKSV